MAAHRLTKDILLIVPVFIFTFLDVLSTNEALTFDDYQLKSTCSSAGNGYDVGNLTQGFWKYRGTTKCLGQEDGMKANCTYTMGFCQSMNTCNGSICASTFNGTGNNKTVSYKLGGLSEKPFTIAAYDYNVIIATYTGGNYKDPITNKTCELKTEIKFECNNKIPWIPVSPKSSYIPKDALVKEEFRSSNCSYKVRFEYAGACLSLVPSGPVPEGLSAGTVLIIIFFVFFGCYFLFGIVFNFFRGYHGKELIPHSDFWTDLPVLVADGMIFACRCGRPESGSAGYDSI